jgi:hypothetical protein
VADFGPALTSLQAFTPDLGAIRQILAALEARGLDPREAYLHLTATRPKDWPALPSFEELMGEASE